MSNMNKSDPVVQKLGGGAKDCGIEPDESSRGGKSDSTATEQSGAGLHGNEDGSEEKG